MPQAICAACGAEGQFGSIRCLACGQPLMFAKLTGANQDATEVMQLVRAISPMLAGRKPEVQSAALADLLSMWLAGHVWRGDPKATKRLREHMLKQHLGAVRTLIDLNYKISVEPQLKANTQ